MAEHDDDTTTDNDLAGLRKAAKEGKAALTENERLRKELLFAKAGIDTDTKIGSMLFKTWESNDLDALKLEARELGIVKNDTPAPKNQPQGRELDDDDDADQAAFRRDFGRGKPAGSTDTPSPDPTDRALREFHEDLKGGRRRADAGLAAIDKVLSAAASGDKRAIFDPTEFAQRARLESASRA